MSVYSYVALKVHTNVQKVGTHLNICLAYRTYVRWKYTFMFSYNNKRSIYLYNEHTFAPPFSFPYLYYTIIYRNENTLSRTLPFPPLSYPFFVYSFIIYSIYRRGNTFPAPFYPFYKVNTFSTAPFLTLIVWGKFAGKSF